MTASAKKPPPNEDPDGFTIQKPAPTDCAPGTEQVDLSLLEESLTKTPWERMQANDDALRFAESLRAAMEKRNAKPQ